MNSQKQSIDVMNKLKSALYCYNVLATVNSEDELLKIYSAANSVLEAANMPLQEWTTNTVELKMVIGREKDRSDKILGLKWEWECDQISVNSSKLQTVTSKKTLLSNASKVFDPMGLISPLTTPKKLLVQET